MVFAHTGLTVCLNRGRFAQTVTSVVEVTLRSGYTWNARPLVPSVIKRIPHLSKLMPSGFGKLSTTKEKSKVDGLKRYKADVPDAALRRSGVSACDKIKIPRW